MNQKPCSKHYTPLSHCNNCSRQVGCFACAGLEPVRFAHREYYYACHRCTAKCRQCQARQLKCFIDATGLCVWSCDALSASSELSDSSSSEQCSASSEILSSGANIARVASDVSVASVASDVSTRSFAGGSESDDDDNDDDDDKRACFGNVAADDRRNATIDMIAGRKEKRHVEEQKLPFYYTIRRVLDKMQCNQKPQFYDAALSLRGRHTLMQCGFVILNSIEKSDDDNNNNNSSSNNNNSFVVYGGFRDDAIRNGVCLRAMTRRIGIVEETKLIEYLRSVASLDSTKKQEKALCSDVLLSIAWPRLPTKLALYLQRQDSLDDNQLLDIAFRVGLSVDFMEFAVYSSSDSCE